MLEKNARQILLISYTAWAFYALAAVTLLPDLIYLTWEIDTNPVVWSSLQIAIIIFGLVGRLLLQPKAGAIKRRLIIACMVVVAVVFAGMANAQTTERQTMKVLVPLVIKWEGEHRCKDDPAMHCAYLDIVKVPTVCFGETRGVKLGQRFTDARCRDKLEYRLAMDFRSGLHRYFTDETKAKRLTPDRDAAYVSLAYNVGIRGAGRSTATRRLNAGDIAGGCSALMWWNRAGGRIVRGLVRRRSAEHALCMKGAA